MLKLRQLSIADYAIKHTIRTHHPFMAKAALWLKDLRSLVRREYGAGWVLEGANDRFKIQKIEGERRGAKRPTVRTQIKFSPISSTEIVNLVNTLAENNNLLDFKIFSNIT